MRDATASSSFFKNRHKIIGDSGTVALGMMDDQRKTPMPIDLHWIGYLL